MTLDLPLQQASEKALLEGIENARARRQTGDRGRLRRARPAATAKCSRSAPRRRFDPNKFAKPLTKREYAALAGSSGSAGERLTDRAVNGTYPTGSTFKPITAMAALEAGVITPSEGLGARPVHLRLDRARSATPAKPNYGAVGLVEALKVSSDTYFFEVGERANAHGNVIQNKAHELGVGEHTGIDLPSEITGRRSRSRSGWPKRTRSKTTCDARAPRPSAAASSPNGRPWTVGDNMDLAVGQGDLLT